jgi:hypothetical protein
MRCHRKIKGMSRWIREVCGVKKVRSKADGILVELNPVEKVIK